jgi:adenylate kinase
MNLVFLGPPGSGKGTQAQKLVESFKLTHLSTGDIFREAIKSQTELGKEIKEFVEQGKLVPDELVSAVVFEKLRVIAVKKPFLLDGYPRTVDQAKDLDRFQEKENIRIDAIVNFTVEGGELVKRLSSRRQCSKCKEVFNLVTLPPKKSGVCDKCSGFLNQRADDQEDVVKERLLIYDQQTAPILDFYQDRPNFFTVDAAQNINSVYIELVSKLKATGLTLTA